MVQNNAEERYKECQCRAGLFPYGIPDRGNSKKLVYSTSRITTLSSTKLHYILHCPLMDKTHSLIHIHLEFPEASRNKIHCSIVARFLNSNIT